MSSNTVADVLNRLSRLDEIVRSIGVQGVLANDNSEQSVQTSIGFNDVVTRGLNVLLFQIIEDFYKRRSGDWAQKIDSFQLNPKSQTVDKLLRQQVLFLSKPPRTFPDVFDDPGVRRSIRSCFEQSSDALISPVSFYWPGSNLDCEHIFKILDFFPNQKTRVQNDRMVLDAILTDLKKISSQVWSPSSGLSFSESFAQLADNRHCAAHQTQLSQNFMEAKKTIPLVAVSCLALDLMVHVAVFSLDSERNLPQNPITHFVEVTYAIENGEQTRVYKPQKLGSFNRSVLKRASRVCKSKEELIGLKRNFGVTGKKKSVSALVCLNKEFKVVDWKIV